jgi:hypothetical protein
MSGYFGESLATPDGGPWSGLTFNFYSNTPPTTPLAVGTAFLLSLEYLGTPAGLSSSTPGLLGQSTGISSGAYVFDPSLTLQPNTTYYIYENALAINTGSATAGASGSHIYFALSDTTNFFSGDIGRANFQLSGEAAPEPSTFALLATGLGGMGFALRRRRRR